MQCLKAFSKKGVSFGCGQCMPCRINRARLWTGRIVLEACSHEHASFVTLTYEDGKLPDGGTLVPRDLQLWLKRLRKRLKPFRFFAVGEYGDRTWRPHYHVALFGIGRECALDIQNTWGNGFTDTGDLTPASARYIAGYTTKKMTSHDDYRLQSGIHPEFARMSLRPGIGASSIPSFATAFRDKSGRQFITHTGDVPSVFKVARRDFPIGRYLRERLRSELNVVANEPVMRGRERVVKMLAMYENSKSTETLTAWSRSREQQKILNRVARNKIYSQKGKIL